MKGNFENHKSTATAHVHGTDKIGTDSEQESENGVEVRKMPSIIIGIQFDQMDKTLTQFQTRFKSHRSCKQGENGSKDS